MSMKKISSELVVIGILKESKLKDEYVTNKCSKKKGIVTFLVSGKEGIMSINLAINIRKLI